MSNTVWSVLYVESAAAAAKSLQSCPTLCDPIDSSLPGSSVPGILQGRTLEWAAISFSNAWKWSRSVVSDPQRPHGLQPTRFLRPWDFPGKSTGVDAVAFSMCDFRQVKNKKTLLCSLASSPVKWNSDTMDPMRYSKDYINVDWITKPQHSTSYTCSLLMLPLLLLHIVPET